MLVCSSKHCSGQSLEPRSNLPIRRFVAVGFWHVGRCGGKSAHPGETGTSSGMSSGAGCSCRPAGRRRPEIACGLVAFARPYEILSRARPSPRSPPLAKGVVVYTTGLFSLVDGLAVRPRCCSVVCASYRGRACSATLESGDAAGNPSAASDMRNARRLHLAGLRGRGIAMKVSRGKWRAGLWTCKRKGMWKAAARWKGATP